MNKVQISLHYQRERRSSATVAANERRFPENLGQYKGNQPPSSRHPMNSITVQVSDELLQYLEELAERCSMTPEELIESNLWVLMNRTQQELFPPDPNPAPTPSGWLRSVVYPAVAQ